ncbi:N-acetyl-glucosamine-6-phosphate deacetylase [Arachnomyces sp. PD_36]|nr:N-acetyl-glucosamine-6-phosphate deacetylase [Arachnomyces sp. PD_36]
MFFQRLGIIFLWISTVTALWPKPKKCELGSSTLWLSPDVELSVLDNSGFPGFKWVQEAFQQILSKVQSSEDEWHNESEEALLQLGFERMKNTLFNEQFVPRKFYPRGTVFEPEIVNGTSTIESVQIEIVSTAKYSGEAHPSPNVGEAYSLSISEDGSVLITTTSGAGGLHALQTFAQLFYAHSQSDSGVYTSYAPVNIVDEPEFAHRGLNLDISRNWIPPKDVLRVIEAMAVNKMNRLHIHATDAQSWPLEIPSLPNLAIDGAYDSSQIWSTEDLKEVQRHGYLHGIEVYLEIDIPGHTTSIAKSHPDLITAENQMPWNIYAEEPPSGQLKLNSSEVRSFMTSVLNDILPRNAKASPLFHFGGDEVNRNAYTLDNTVKSSSKEVLQPLLQSFMDHVFKIAKKHSITPILWEEMLLEWNLTLPDSTIIQTWRSKEALSHVLSKGHRVLFGANTHFYLDCGFGAFYDPIDPDNPGENPMVNPPYLDYCTPYKNWRHIYSHQPLAGIPEEQKHLVLGGEVHLWGEMTDPSTLDGMLWPRAAAAAELLWRGPGNPVSEDTTRRLAEMRERLVLKGVAAGMVQMEWCLRNRGSCVL